MNCAGGTTIQGVRSGGRMVNESLDNNAANSNVAVNGAACSTAAATGAGAGGGMASAAVATAGSAEAPAAGGTGSGAGAAAGTGSGAGVAATQKVVTFRDLYGEEGRELLVDLRLGEAQRGQAAQLQVRA